MDKQTQYRDIIHRVLQDYATWKLSSPQVRSEVIFDPVLDHFEWKYLDWGGLRRIHSRAASSLDFGVEPL